MELFARTGSVQGARVIVAPGAAAVRLTLPARGRISGTVLGPDGRPVAGAWVDGHVDEQQIPSSLRAVTTEWGTFTLYPFPAGHVVIRATHDHFAPSEAHRTNLGPGASITASTLHLAEAGSTSAVEGRGRLDDAAPQ